MNAPRLVRAVVCGCLAVGCTAGVRDRADGGGRPDGSSPQPETNDAAASDSARPCINLQCQQVKCPGEPTSISGTAFAPNGTLPLYNVRVYVPNTPLAPFKAGVTCDQCSALVSGNPIVSAVSNEEGKFKLTNVPAGKDIPLVFQLGKWRRKVTIPNVAACQDNPIGDANVTRLPRNKTEGDLPRIAVTTGSCDQLGCLLPKVGVDVAELGVTGENKAVHFYQGGGASAAFGPRNMLFSLELWNSELALKHYDVTLLSCECSEALTSKPTTSFDAMTSYLAAGGRMFGTDFQYVWLRYASDPQLAGALGRSAGMGGNPLTIDTTFPKGKAMADWMKFLDPAMSYGEIVAEQVFGNWGEPKPGAVQVWATSGGGRLPTGAKPAIVTVNTPVGAAADKQCGRAAHIDAHITLPSTNIDPANFPGGCGDKLTPGEEALAFLFFDLTACIQPDSEPIYPPIIVP